MPSIHLPHDANCIFCKIIAGQIPCYAIHEDHNALAFLDIGPLSEGHCLLIPKSHHATIDQMPADEVAACARLLPKLSAAIKKATGCQAWNILQNNGEIAGQAVGHVHFHLIPRKEADGLGYRWAAGKLDQANGQRLVALIRQHLPPSPPPPSPPCPPCPPHAPQPQNNTPATDH